MTAIVYPLYLSETTKCRHCQNKIENKQYGDFCCNGCQQVFSILNTSGLKDFYKISEIEKSHIPKVDYEPNLNLYLADNDFISKFGTSSKGGVKFYFYVSGIHCQACLWIFNRINQLSSLIKDSTFNQSNHVLKIEVLEIDKLKEIFNLLNQLGYQLIPIQDINQVNQLEKNDDKNELIRIAITAALLMNMMLFSISLYAGVEGEFKRIFQYILFFLTLPLMFYSANPIFKNFWNFFKAKSISIDLPLIIFLLTSFFISSFNLINGSDDIYFDSIATLVFLVLSVRYVLKKIQKNVSNLSYLKEIFFSKQVFVKYEEEFFPKHYSSLKTGEIILVDVGDVVPVDGVISNGETFVNEAIMTGEVEPIYKKEGDNLISGTLNVSNKVELKVSNTLFKTKLGEILNELGEKLIINSELNINLTRYSIGLIVAIIISIFATNYLFPELSTSEFINRCLSILVITCPCALAIGIPLSFILGVKEAAKKGIVVQDIQIFNKIHRLKNIFFDKTGTLTTGEINIHSHTVKKNMHWNIIFSLEKGMSHPYTKPIEKFAKKEGASEVILEKKKEILGKGVEGYFGGNLYEIKASSADSIGLFENSILVGELLFTEEIDNGAFDLLTNLKKKYNLAILSGDRKDKVESLAKKLNINKTFSQLLPSDKRDIIKNTPGSMIIGDGANDILGFKESDISVATFKSSKLASSTCDAYLLSSDLSLILELIKISKTVYQTVKFNIIISVIYNLLGFWAASFGYINPLMAAIFMPLSSITIIAHTYFNITKERS